MQSIECKCHPSACNNLLKLDEKIEEFYVGINNVIDRKQTNYILIMAFMTKVGIRKERVANVGKIGIEKRND